MSYEGGKARPLRKTNEIKLALQVIPDTVAPVMATPCAPKGETTTETIAVKITHQISRQRISDLLCSAFEGGSNYWYVIEKFIQPETLNFRTDEEEIFKHLDYPLNEGGAILIGDNEDEDAGTKRLDLKSIQKGLRTMAKKYPRHMSDFLNENDDAGTGDVFLQCCLFGDVIYG